LNTSVRKCILIEIRTKFNLIHEKEWIGDTISNICKRYGVTRKTYYKWMSRYKQKMLLYGQIYSKIKDLYKEDDGSYVERISESLENIREWLREISKSGKQPHWFHYDSVLLGDLLTENIQGDFHVSTYVKFLEVYQKDAAMRESIKFTNLLDRLGESDQTLCLIKELIKLLELLNRKTQIPPRINPIKERVRTEEIASIS
jgi:transposase-like protein